MNSGWRLIPGDVLRPAPNASFQAFDRHGRRIYLDRSRRIRVGFVREGAQRCWASLDGAYLPDLYRTPLAAMRAALKATKETRSWRG